MFPKSKCRGESDLRLCISSKLAKTTPLHSADFRQILRPNTFTNRKSLLRSGILFASFELMHRPRCDCRLYFDIGNLQQICTDKWNAARRLHAAAMPERWPRVCRVKITFELLLTICFVSTTTNSMKCLVNWIPLNTHVRVEQNLTLP